MPKTLHRSEEADFDDALLNKSEVGELLGPHCLVELVALYPPVAGGGGWWDKIELLRV